MSKLYLSFGWNNASMPAAASSLSSFLTKWYLMVFLTVGLPFLAQAQRLVRGTVKDTKGQPVIAASVTEKGTKKMTITDANGHFSITLRGNTANLLISSVGFKSKEVPTGTSSQLTVVLDDDQNALNEVVVVGYGSVKKGDLTGSVSAVKGDDMIIGGTTANLGQAIQGKAAGVQVQQNSFAPGAASSITIRGGNSINTSNAPLYVVDGFISDNGNLINPNDIDDVQILKDASATAIYGSRGGNGVILITTKKGKTGRVAIDADVSSGRQFLTYKPSLLNGQQYTDIMNATALEDGNPPPFPPSFQIANTNWLDAAMQDASIQNSTFSISGADKTSKIYVAGNYFNQTGVLKKTGMERYTARIGAEKTLNDEIKISANFFGSNADSRLQSYNGDITAPLYSLLTAQPNLPIYNADGSYYIYNGRNNALASLLEPTNNSNLKIFNGNTALDYSPFKGFTYHFGAGAEYTQTSAGQYTPRTLTAGKINNGIAAQQQNNTFRYLLENYVTYKQKIERHEFTAMVGTSFQKDATNALNVGSKGFPTDVFLYYNLSAGSTVNGYGSDRAQSSLFGIFGRLNYSFADKLLATFTLRDDASSKFGSNFRHGIFPSGAIAYKLTEEPFIKNLNAFSSLKARVSYGVTGNDRITNYQYLSTYSNYSTILSQGGALQVGIEPSTLSNPNLKWESTAQFDVGLDMGFAHDRITATIDYYRKKTSDLLINIPIGQWWGFSTQMVNGGAIENKGIELGINTINIQNSNLRWSTSFNIAYNKQKALSLSNNVKQISVNTANPSGTVSGREYTRVVPGRELRELYGYVYAGVLKTGETYAPQPNAKPGDPKYTDLDGDGVITPNDQTYLGNTNPRFTMGFGNDFSYKGIDLSIFFAGAFDYHLYNMNRLVLESTTSTDALNRFVAGVNENTDVPREGYFLSTYGGYVNSRFVENATYLRLRSLSLGYTLPAKLFSKMKILKGLRIYAEAQNLFTITNYSGTDPEVSARSENTAAGIDFNAFPAFRTFMAGIKGTIF